MEPQPWKSLGRIECRPPGVADVTLAGAVWWLLHTQPQVHELIAGTAALLLLRCVRIHNPAGVRR
ncbi:hypothetical protein AB0N20_29575 [Streptomyces griseoincarnatus]